MPRPQKTKRNKDLVRKRIEDPKEWSFGVLEDHFRIKKEWAWRIFTRDLEKYATPEEVKEYKKYMKESKN